MLIQSSQNSRNHCEAEMLAKKLLRGEMEDSVETPIDAIVRVARPCFGVQWYPR